MFSRHRCFNILGFIPWPVSKNIESLSVFRSCLFGNSTLHQNGTKMRYNVLHFNSRSLFFYDLLFILHLKCETCFRRFKQNLHFTGSSIQVVLRATKRISAFVIQKGQRAKQRETTTLGSRKNVLRRVMWFFTFYDVFNRLELTFRGGANKGRKISPLPRSHLDGFRERRATTRSVASLANPGR